MRVWTAAFGVLAAAVAMAVAAFWSASPAAAHPLGNFTVNHYARIDASGDGITVFRVLDMAEIPTFQLRQRIDTDGDGEVSPAEAEVFAAARSAELAENMMLRADGREVALSAVSHAVDFPEGQAGLRLLRLEVTYRADLEPGWAAGGARIEFEDRNDLDRIGWREIIVRGGTGVELRDSSVPATDISNELRAYPQNSLSSPLDVRSATASLEPGAGAPLPARQETNERAVRGNPDGTLARFTELIAQKELGAGAIAVALLAAAGFGAIHALSPGHGKTVVAAYLVGSRGTARHAVLLGLVVTATHTSSVYALGFISLYLSEYIVPEKLYPWLSITSGGLILLMGCSLMVTRLRATGLPARVFGALKRALQPSRGGLVLATQPAVSMDSAHARETHHAHVDHALLDAHDHHDDQHEGHSHGFGGRHAHVMPGADGQPVTARQLVGLGMFGGMLPCPSAIVVMLSAIALHRVALGLLLILAFSAGLAAVLSAIGFGLVYARAIGQRVPFLQRAASRAAEGSAGTLVARAFPVVSAAAVMAAGLVITLRALA